MKSFITAETVPSGKKRFAAQCEGASLATLASMLVGEKLIGCLLSSRAFVVCNMDAPTHFASRLALEFSSASTDIGSWQEVGSLNVRVASLSSTSTTTAAEPSMVSVTFDPMELAKIEKIVYEDSDVIVEYGVLLHARGEAFVTVAVGIPPGSVSVQAPFSNERFAPQFDLGLCRREPMQ
jgi:hypothetical protein